MSGTFEASYAGWCAADCGQRIRAGDLVAYADDELMHEGCADREVESTRRFVAGGKPCTSCWMVHAGECM